MTTAAYISLTNSNASATYKFRVVMGTLQPVLNKTQNRRRTWTGKSDSQFGFGFWSWAMTLRVHASEALSGYGNLANLISLYNLIDPSDTPSTTIIFTDHLGNTWNTELVGTLNEENLTPYLDGSDAAYLININLEQIS